MAGFIKVMLAVYIMVTALTIILLWAFARGVAPAYRVVIGVLIFTGLTLFAAYILTSFS